MPRGGKNHAQGGGEIAQGGEIFARALRAQDSIFFPPLANFSCTPLCIYIYLYFRFRFISQNIDYYI